MSYALQVFVSSTCHDLRDLRAVVRNWFDNRKINAHLSDEIDFPSRDDMSPYASCLRVLEECPLVVGIIDRRYGSPLTNWAPYNDYEGLAATHAELRHALSKGKRVLMFIHKDVLAHYETYRKNKDAFIDPKQRPTGLEPKTLEMVAEFKLREPAPWIRTFESVIDICEALDAEFINQLYEHLVEREARRSDRVGHLLKLISDAGSEVTEAIRQKMAAEVIRERDAIQAEVDRLTALQAKANKPQTMPTVTMKDLWTIGNPLNARLDEAKGLLEQINSAFELTSGGKISTIRASSHSKLIKLTPPTKASPAVKISTAKTAPVDSAWIAFASNVLNAPALSRVPLQNSLELAVRGYTVAGNAKAPRLDSITWRKLSKTEAGIHRGYEAGLIFEGADFVPGVAWTTRRIGEKQNNLWRQPNIFFGAYLEVSAGTDPIEGPLSWRDYEFQLRNPEGQLSAWVAFGYSFDIPDLERRLEGFQNEIGTAEAAGQLEEASNLGRKAFVFSDRLFGKDAPRTILARGEYDRLLNEFRLSKLRFREKDCLRVTSGAEAGRAGVVRALRLNDHHAYVIEDDKGVTFQAADEEVERDDGAKEGS